MQFIQSDSWDTGISVLKDRLARSLDSGLMTLWLVSGGSNIDASVQIMDSLSNEETTLLTIMLTDERFGPEGHPNSNATQLIAKGFKVKQATWIPVLRGDRSLASTTSEYEINMRQAISMNETIIGQFGIGSDGHISGILPESVATEASDLICAYQASDYSRLTTTAAALTQVNLAIAFAFGANKAAALHRLHDFEVPFREQPSQILKQLPEAFIYNDQVGDA
jgi:6-phosphogluconolactonase/glucosamine-6-phosphate isomerase/deaminase